MTNKTSSTHSQHGRAKPASGVRRVFIHDMEIMTHVGVFAVEQRYEQRIVVSLDLMVVDSYDGVSDRVRDILDYGEVAKGVQNVVQAGHVNLIETLAERIASYCLSFPTVQSARVRIEKPDTLTGIRRVGIEIDRPRPAD